MDKPELCRLLRSNTALQYLGMSRHSFNTFVRPYVTSIRLGKRGIAYDRLDLDAWVDQNKFGGDFFSQRKKLIQKGKTQNCFKKTKPIPFKKIDLMKKFEKVISETSPRGSKKST